MTELSLITKRYNNTMHHSIKLTPVQLFKTKNEKTMFSNVQKKEVLELKFKLGQLFRTANIRRVMSKGDSTNWSYTFYTKTEVIHYTIPSQKNNFLSEKNKENLLKATKLNLEEDNQVIRN